MVLPLNFVLEDLRDQLVKKGSKGIEGIIIAKKQLDDDNYISKGAFRNFISYTSLKANPEEIACLLNTYETNNHDRFKFLEFLLNLRGKLSKPREELVIKAFYKLDEDKKGYITLEKIREAHNAKCDSKVMLERFSAQHVTDDFLATSFGRLELVTLNNFLEYYTLLGSTIICDSQFDLILMKHWKVTRDDVDVDAIENKVKLVVYKNRIRSREFMRDFDKLRGGLITESQFASALDNSTIKLTPREVKVLCDNYRVLEDQEMRVCWTAFCDEIDRVFTFKELEKTPWMEPPPVPELPGLAPQRFEQGIVYLGPNKENQMATVLNNIKQECKRRRVSLRGFFDDAVSNRNSSKAVGHVTKQQFCQALSSKAGLRLSPEEISLLVEKFDDLHNGMVNYVAFSTEVDPFLQAEDIT